MGSYGKERLLILVILPYKPHRAPTQTVPHPHTPLELAPSASKNCSWNCPLRFVSHRLGVFSPELVLCVHRHGFHCHTNHSEYPRKLSPYLHPPLELAPSASNNCSWNCLLRFVSFRSSGRVFTGTDPLLAPFCGRRRPCRPLCCW